MIRIVPHCPKCKSSKDVKIETAKTSGKNWNWFEVTFCDKCREVISCMWIAGPARKDETWKKS